jgi:threonine dehydrogenase-like Zn-dependent dehydrogenase
VPEPRIESGNQVLFRIHEVGVCGTDRELASFRIGFPPANESFLVIGHEALGQVVDTGAEVRDFAKGDWVVPAIRRACGAQCSSCVRGREDLCLSGGARERGIFGLHGYFSEYAVDDALDLVRIPAELVDCAVLVEPLSVVEKAVERALLLHQGEPQRALVLGAGPIGILSGLALLSRGLEVALHSVESPDHPRARLSSAAGLEYLTNLKSHRADIVIEATGSPDAALAAIHATAPVGVCGILGASIATGEISFLDMVVGNQTVFGSVNASPESFKTAVHDLSRFDRKVLASMIRRAAFSDFRTTIPDPPAGAPKVVHVIAP